MRKSPSKIPLSLFLHFYQPPNQQEDILERIVFESYRPILDIFLKNPTSAATFNFPAGLVELLEKCKHLDIVKKLKTLVSQNRIELTGSAAYHAFLPFLPIAEIKRQILINEQGLSKVFGKSYSRNGFFPPELTFSTKVAKVVEGLGFSWMAIPMISLGSQIPDFTTLYKLDGYNLYLFPRHKRASSVILSAAVRSKQSFLEWIKNGQPIAYYLLIMDAETFGHHRPGLEDLLEELVGAGEFELLQVSDLIGKIDEVVNIQPREASWSNEEQDFWLEGERTIAAKNPFLLWKDPANPIHKLQWQLTALAIKAVRNLEFGISNAELENKIQHSAFSIHNFGRKNLKKPTKNEKRWLKARGMLDKALSSDQYWWASAKPWWSLEMIEAGCWQLVQVVKTATSKNSESTQKAVELYRKIIDKAFNWQRSGYIRRAHKQASVTVSQPPFVKRAPREWYNQIILEFEDEMKKAAAKLEFEKAVKWRDALYKLKTGADVFDILHVVDELHTYRKIPSLKPFLLHKNWQISKFAKKYLQKLSRDELLEGKKNLRKQGYKI